MRKDMNHGRRMRKKTIVLAILGVFFIGAAVSPVASQQTGRDFVPIRIRNTDDARPKPPLFSPSLSESRYIGFGDSITYGTINHEDHPELGYIPRLDVILDAAFGPTDVYNEGWGGEMTSAGALRIGSVIAVRQARYILILEGTNDVTFLRPIEGVRANLRSMVSQCLEAGLLPALSTLTPRRDVKWYIASHREIHLAINAAVRQLAPEWGIPLVDMDAAFAAYPDGGVDALLSADLKHPNEEGYQVMAETWAAAIKKYPFPPVEVQAERVTDKILFYWKSGIMVTWRPNSKTAASGAVAGFRVYRRLYGQDRTGFVLVAELAGTDPWFDTSVQSGTVYEYVITAFRADGVEGHASELAAVAF